MGTGSTAIFDIISQVLGTVGRNEAKIHQALIDYDR